MSRGKQTDRLAEGGLIERDKLLRFFFDGQIYEGYQGDTLASALLANGVRLVGRSFKYHRPRGILSAGAEEPNALVELRDGARCEPNTRTTTAELYEGLIANSQNRWPSLKYDLLSANSLVSRFLPAGFYYKTFMWPKAGWKLYEHFIRQAAGMGSASRQADPDRYEKMNGHCDVLVVGAGPTGLVAARQAAESGARVMLVDENARIGDSLVASTDQVEGQSLHEWGTGLLRELATMSNVTCLPRTTAFGCYDGLVIGLVERVTDHEAHPSHQRPRQRFWKVRTRQVILATGAIERPLVFANNDLPGIMTAHAVRRYIAQYAVRPGRRAVVFTNNDGAYATAFALQDAGCDSVTLLDSRTEPSIDLREAAKAKGIEVLPSAVVHQANGGTTLTSIDGAPWDAASKRLTSGSYRLNCDLLAVSGGWLPSVHLHCHLGGRPVYDPELFAFVPGPLSDGYVAAGACAGHMELAACIEGGSAAGRQAVENCGLGTVAALQWSVETKDPYSLPAELWEIPHPDGKEPKKLVDFQDDVAASDVRLAHREGYVSVEHLKRYTTLGMGTDQGKTSNVNGLAIMAATRGKPIPEVGTTTFRPPYSPVSFGALAGQDTGPHLAPTRRTPMHHWHLANGAVMVEAGAWVRPRYYTTNGPTLREAYIKETALVREKVGLVDVSTLGKIDVQGPDAPEFLNRVYVNGWAKLAVGKARYGIMLREDGFVMDDGTAARISDSQYYMTTTTANAAKVMTHLEYYLAVVWPELRVRVTTITDQWGAMALSGPLARKVLEACVADADVSDEALPFMGVSHGTIAGRPVRLMRVSFSGEMAYEIHTPAGFGLEVWKAVMEAGEGFGIIPYGTEALGALRIEKGHVAGPELDGRTTLGDIGLGRMASTKKRYIGEQLAKREDMIRDDRPSLAGLQPKDPNTALHGGGLIVATPNAGPGTPILGHVTSITYSPAMKSHIALGLVAGGKTRIGETLYVADPVRNKETEITVVDPIFFDPEGARLHG